MFTDSEMLDWLSSQYAVSMKAHYNGFVDSWSDDEKKTHGFNGNIDFFTCASQHINDCPSLREAVQKAMEMDLANRLCG